MTAGTAYTMNYAETAFEFIEMLSPTHGWFPITKPDSGMVYRGHSQGSNPLIPSALRSPNPLKDLISSWRVGNLGIPVPVEGDTHSSQVTLEYLSLKSFFDQANFHALTLPNYAEIQWFFDKAFPWGISKFQRGQEPWPPRVLLPLMSLAQHYELPTRLLDWTNNAYFAAYFAAKGAAKKLIRDPNKYPELPSWESSKEQFFVVWGLDVASIKVRMAHQSSSQNCVPFPDANLSIFNAPSALIPNLAAQKGLFTFYVPGKDIKDDSKTDRAQMDSISRDLFQGHLLFALVCPVRQARLVLFWLAHQGITAATVYPGYRGVVESIKERQLWETADRNNRFIRTVSAISSRQNTHSNEE